MQVYCTRLSVRARLGGPIATILLDRMPLLAPPMLMSDSHFDLPFEATSFIEISLQPIDSSPLQLIYILHAHIHLIVPIYCISGRDGGGNV